MGRRTSGGGGGGQCMNCLWMLIMILKIALSLLLAFLIFCTAWALVAQLADKKPPAFIDEVVFRDMYGPSVTTVKGEYHKANWFDVFCLVCLLISQCLILLGVCLESACALLFFVIINVAMLIIRVTLASDDPDYPKLDTSSWKFIIFLIENIGLAVYSIILCVV